MVIAGLLVLLGIEAASFAAYWLATGEPCTWANARAARDRVLEPVAVADAVATAQAAATQSVVPHPFLGYVLDADGPGLPGHVISRWGLLDEVSPLRAARADRFTIGIVGGSVAQQLGLYAADALAAALQRSPALAGRRVDIVHLALGGWKQPQQLFAVQLACLLGGHFDCIVNIDGFNEVTLVEENVPFGVPGWFPRSWSRLADRAPAAEQLLRLGRLALERDERRRAAVAAADWWWSPTVQFLWWWRDQQRQAAIRDLQLAIEHAPASGAAATGPGVGGASVDAARAEMAALWRDASLALHTFCRARGITYCHFLQPNQYVAGQKPIGADEARRALAPDSVWQRGVAIGYPLLQAELPRLRAAGVAASDLTAIFADHAEPLYVDACCHFGPRGNTILAEHVAAGVRAQLEPPGAPAVALDVAPTPLQVGPLRPTPLQVFAVDAAGARRDVTGVAFGTGVRVEPVDGFVVGIDGSLRALQRGQGTVTVEHAGLRRSVPVVAAWPAQVVGDDGQPDAAGIRPRLAVEWRSDHLLVRCEALPDPAVRLLVVGPRPLPTAPIGADLDGLQLVPLPAKGAVEPVAVPLPPIAGRPLFVRAYALAADAATVLAATPTVALTRD